MGRRIRGNPDSFSFLSPASCIPSQTVSKSAYSVFPWRGKWSQTVQTLQLYLVKCPKYSRVSRSIQETEKTRQTWTLRLTDSHQGSFFLPLRTKTGAFITVTDHRLPRILHVRMDVNASTRGSWSPMILHFTAVQLTSTSTHSCLNCSPVLVRPCLLLHVCNLSTTGTTFPLNVTPVLLLYFFVVWFGLWGTPVNTGPRGFLWYCYVWSVSEGAQMQVVWA